RGCGGPGRGAGCAGCLDAIAGQPAGPVGRDRRRQNALPDGPAAAAGGKFPIAERDLPGTARGDDLKCDLSSRLFAGASAWSSLLFRAARAGTGGTAGGAGGGWLLTASGAVDVNVPGKRR